MSASVESKVNSSSAVACASGAFTNFLAVGSGEVIGRLFAFASMLYAARHIGAAGYGVIAFAATITLYFAKVADFGIETIGTGEIAKNRDQISHIASAILSMRLLIAGMLVFAAVATVALFLQDPGRSVFAFYFLTLVPIAASTKWIHLGLERARPVALWRVAGEAVTFGLVVLLVRYPSDLWRIPVAILIGDGLVAFALIRLLARQGYALKLCWAPRTAWPVFKRALPVLGVLLAGLLIFNLDIVFLSLMRPSQTVGLYAAAYSLIGLLANVCTLYGITLLPTLTRLRSHTLDERQVYHTAMAQIFALTLPISVGGMFIAQNAILLGFGEEYGLSGPVLRILVWTVVPYALRVVAWAALVARGDQGLALRAIIYGVFANATLNLVLIHFYGMAGAAAASVATEVLTSALTLHYAVRTGFPMTPLVRFWRPVAAVLIMAAALWMLRGGPAILQLAVGMTTYAVTLFCLGGIKLRGRVPALAV
jgi:O-antigen/teichoic acid export membrane protein